MFEPSTQTGVTLQVAELESRLQAELEARLGGEGAVGAMADLRRLDAALAAAADAEELRQRAALVDGLQAQVRGNGFLPVLAVCQGSIVRQRRLHVLAPRQGSSVIRAAPQVTDPAGLHSA
jgi:hypothetical protein